MNRIVTKSDVIAYLLFMAVTVAALVWMSFFVRCVPYAAATTSATSGTTAAPAAVMVGRRSARSRSAGGPCSALHR